MFRHPFYNLPPFLFLEGVFAPYSPVLTQPSCEQHCQLGWATEETVRICWVWKESKWTVNFWEATGGFERLTEVCAGNITAPEPPGGLHQTGLYNRASDSWAETHLWANSSEEKVTKPKWLTGKWNLQRQGCFDSLLTHLTLATVMQLSVQSAMWLVA